MVILRILWAFIKWLIEPHYYRRAPIFKLERAVRELNPQEFIFNRINIDRVMPVHKHRRLIILILQQVRDTTMLTQTTSICEIKRI